MNYGQSFIQQLLEFLVNEKPDAKENKQFKFDAVIDQIKVQINLSDFDKFSFVIDRIEICGLDGHRQTITADKLKQRGELIVSKLTYLLEAIQPVELDAHNLKLLLRSRSPENNQTTISYFEMLMEATGRVSLQRYRYDKGEETRTPVPFHLTKDVLIKLINDIVDVIRC